MAVLHPDRRLFRVAIERLAVEPCRAWPLLRIAGAVGAGDDGLLAAQRADMGRLPVQRKRRAPRHAPDLRPQDRPLLGQGVRSRSRRRARAPHRATIGRARKPAGRRPRPRPTCLAISRCARAANALRRPLAHRRSRCDRRSRRRPDFRIPSARGRIGSRSAVGWGCAPALCGRAGPRVAIPRPLGHGRRGQ
jgi:hypothetical protein